MITIMSSIDDSSYCKTTVLQLGSGMESNTMVLVLSTLSTGCNVLYLVFKSNIRQTIMYLYLEIGHILTFVISCTLRKYNKKYYY